MTAVDPRKPGLYERVRRVIPPIEWPVFEADIEAILRLKRQHDAIILAHNYQSPEIFHCVADAVGDSLALAREAAKSDARMIVMAGVHFMAETAKLLNPSKTVLIPEARRPRQEREGLAFGRPMIGDHRRILATGIARVRAKIKYNPVVFELMPAVFTLLQLQRCVEAIAGLSVHKPNFRRLIEQQQLVEETGETVSDTGGRPAKAFRFRSAVREERAAAGTKLPLMRA